MKIFISWSGDRSRQIASALKEWLPDLIQNINIFMSQHDIEAGARWGNEIGNQLQDCNIGIICVNPENINAPWLLYEAGCLGKSFDQSRVIPFLLGMHPTDIPFPLAQFQSVSADKNGTLKLIESINSSNSNRLEPERLNRIFDKFWPDLSDKVNSILKSNTTQQIIRTDRELLEEALQLIRGIDRDIKKPIHEYSQKSEPAVPSEKTIDGAYPSAIVATIKSVISIDQEADLMPEKETPHGD